MNSLNKFIGKGLGFPLEIDSNGRAVNKGGLDLIEQSIIIILNWPHNNRFFNQRFGARLWEVLEEPNDNIGNLLVRNFVFTAINLWETRIELLEVSILEDTATLAKVDLELKYKIRNSKIEETFIFPFYKELIY